ncbi:MAG: hypothetical protein BVN35_01705 [Proteobacteria bacterium ST_bin11]|nr:MAG: hypothetical protein BVN35_01705 [Proteobacteria bacterium ST_bin11]
MAFVNEKITEQDKTKIGAVINYENIRKQARYIPEFDFPRTSFWVPDRERGVYLIFLTGGGREQLNYYALVIDDQPVIFNVDPIIKGNNSIGRQDHLNIYDLLIPEPLESRREEIKQLIREGLEEKAYLSFTADGGTANNPNLVARSKIISFDIEFK